MVKYEYIGPRVGTSDIELDTTGAQRFHSIARLGSRIKDLRISDTETFVRSTSYASSMLSDAWGDYNIANYTHIAKNRHVQEPVSETSDNLFAYDRSIIHFAKYRDSQRDTKVFDTYEVEQMDNELFTAKRTVRVVRHLSKLAIEEGGIIERPGETVGIRKAFERPITEDDLDTIEQKIQRIMARQAVVGRR